jgi:hypothetical protein
MGDANLAEDTKHALETLSVLPIVCETSELTSQKLSDDTIEIISKVAAGGKIFTGARRGYQMVLALSGFSGNSLVLFNDMRHPEQKQRLDLPFSDHPWAVSFNIAGTMVAALTSEGLVSVVAFPNMTHEQERCICSRLWAQKTGYLLT